MKGRRYLLALVVWSWLSASCTGEPQKKPDAGSGATQSSGGGGNQGGAGGGASASSSCYPFLSGLPTTIEDPDLDYSPTPSFVWTGRGVAAVWPASGGMGLRLLETDENGDVTVPVRTLWASEIGLQSPMLAVSGDVPAVVDQVGEGPNKRQTCRIALAQLAGKDPIAGPTRFSDAPKQDSVLNEAQYCTVAAANDAFLVVWQQMTSDTTIAFSLFGQWINTDGSLRDSRITLASNVGKPFGVIPIASDGQRVAVVLPSNSGSELSLAFVEGDQVKTSSLDLTGANAQPTWMQLSAAHDGWLVHAGDQAWLLDADGTVAHGPITADANSAVGPLNSGFVLISHEEFLVAYGLDVQLGSPSAAVGLSSNRSASVNALIYAPNGRPTFLVYNDNNNLQLAKFSCSSEMPPPPGPAACSHQVPLTPLADECKDAVCHVIIRLDFMTLGMLGWQVVGGGAASTDEDAGTTSSVINAEGARAAAQDVFAQDPYVAADIMISGPDAGVFSAYVQPGDIGAFALIGENSGTVIVAGGITYAGQGAYLMPSTWRPASDIACGNEAATPSETFYLDSQSCGPNNDQPPAEAPQALNIALTSNLAAYMASQGPFSAYVYIYAPAVGPCDPGVTEYLVVLTQVRQ